VAEEGDWEPLAAILADLRTGVGAFGVFLELTMLGADRRCKNSWLGYSYPLGEYQQHTGGMDFTRDQEG
jgi:hypothetical protein